MSETNNLEAYFGDLPDPRVTGRCTYKLVEIIIIAICAVLSGAEGWEDIEEFGQSKEGWLRQFLELENGIPSHDTFRRVFSVLDGAAFQERFIRWVEGVFTVTRGQVVSIDGKTARGSQDKSAGKNALHLVSAWASASGVLLGQRKVDAKSNEITAIPALLEQLYIAGCIVTIDAMGCQTAIAQTIIDRHADYVLALKGNQGHLHEDVQEWFAWAKQSNFAQMAHSTAQTVNKGHGRLEIRRCYALADPQAFEVIRHHDGWAGLQSIVMVERERHLPAGQVQSETAYFISSLPADAKLLLHATRAHWSVENTFHWTLDVTFREDDARLRTGDSAENFAVLRHIAFNLLKRHPAKLSLKRKRYKAALDEAFLFDLVSQV
jgi:predicted transposase YbfD/YdcC